MPQPAALPARALADLPSTLDERRWHPRQDSATPRRRIPLARWRCCGPCWPPARGHAQTKRQADAAAAPGHGGRRTKPVAGIAGFGDLPLAQRAAAGRRDHRRADEGPGHPPPVRHRQDRRRGRRRLQRRGLLGLPDGARLRASTTASTTGATACRSAPRPRSRWTTRRASRCSRAPAACTPASARRAAWSTWSSSARPTRRSARPSSAGARTAACSASTDLGERFGEQREFGLRLNAAYEHLDPQTYVADGSRYLLALAGDWRVNADTVLEAEIENSPPLAAQRAGLQPARQRGAASRATRAST